VSGWPGAAARASLDGLDVHRVGGRLDFALHARRYFRRHLAAGDFDLLVEDLNKVPLFTPRWKGPPVVLLVHHLFGATAFQEASLPVAAATWLLEQPLARVYGRVPVQAVSRSTADDLVRRGFDPARIEVIPNGVDLGFYYPEPAVPRYPDPTILYLGRLKRYKRVDLVIRALALLRDDGVQARLILAGRGDHAGALRRLRDDLGLAARVDMPGYVTDEQKRELFRRVWVHALTSPKEGWGITNLEAAACGTPTVASDSPGLRDSVVHGETGFLVPHGDVALLAERLRVLILDHELRARLGTRARAFAQGFSWDRAATGTERHLALCLGEADPGHR
jgi:glycosyltransferase involved in cell wall biosynthesis